MSGPSCGTCRYGVELPNDEIACHRFPPWVVDTLADVRYLWPVLTSDDWCGEHDDSTEDDTEPD